MILARNSLIGRFGRHYPAVAGLFLLALVVAMALLAPVLFPQGPWRMVGRPQLWPGQNPRFPLGTDILGRDLLACLFYGARVSLLIGLSATLAATLIGTVIGAAAGFFGGRVDRLLMGFTEIFQTTPPFVLAVVVVAAFTPSLASIIVAISLVSWPPLARLVRAQFLQLLPREFVLADHRNRFRHVGDILRAAFRRDDEFIGGESARWQERARQCAEADTRPDLHHPTHALLLPKRNRPAHKLC